MIEFCELAEKGEDQEYGYGVFQVRWIANVFVDDKGVTALRKMRIVRKKKEEDDDDEDVACDGNDSNGDSVTEVIDDSTTYTNYHNIEKSPHIVNIFELVLKTS